MDRVAIVSDCAERADTLSRRLAGIFETSCTPRGQLSNAPSARYAIIDIDLHDGSNLADLRTWLSRRPKNAKAIFAVDHGVRHESVQAFAIGATDVIERPLDRRKLLSKLLGDFGSLADDPAAARAGRPTGVAAGVGALRGIFDSVVGGTPIELEAVEASGAALVTDIDQQGFGRWIDLVRTHHSQTYQHCLLVTGVAAGFGRHLGCSSADRQKLALAGLLHDLGKAAIPVSILEKPAPLNEAEMATMRRHPQLGFDALKDTAGVNRDMLDIVLHHHEYLDGSGYPHGLHASEIPDLVRLMTISDIYGALIERRPYHAPLSREAALTTLEEMGPKLDRDLLREFKSFVVNCAR
jgi:putative nucleotidyltransferase with HDIG domain